MSKASCLCNLELERKTDIKQKEKLLIEFVHNGKGSENPVRSQATQDTFVTYQNSILVGLGLLLLGCEWNGSMRVNGKNDLYMRKDDKMEENNVGRNVYQQRKQKRIGNNNVTI